MQLKVVPGLIDFQPNRREPISGVIRLAGRQDVTVHGLVVVNPEPISLRTYRAHADVFYYSPCARSMGFPHGLPARAGRSAVPLPITAGCRFGDVPEQRPIPFRPTGLVVLSGDGVTKVTVQEDGQRAG